MDEFLKLGKDVLASQPFSRLVGAELTGFSQGQVELDHRDNRAAEAAARLVDSQKKHREANYGKFI